MAETRSVKKVEVIEVVSSDGEETVREYWTEKGELLANSKEHERPWSLETLLEGLENFHGYHRAEVAPGAEIRVEDSTIGHPLVITVGDKKAIIIH